MSSRHGRSPRTYGLSLTLLLVGSLVLSGVLAYQAHRAARSHRTAAESAVRDFAAFASWQLSRALGSELDDLLYEAYEAHLQARLDRSAGPGALARYAREVRSETLECGCPEAISGIFSLDLRDGTLEVVDSTLSPVAREWIAGNLPGAASAPAAGSAEAAEAEWTSESFRRPRFPTGADVRIQAHLPGEPASRLIYTLVRNAEGEPVRAFGFVLDVPAYAAAWARNITTSEPLLPPSRTGALRNQDVLSVALSRGDEPAFFVLDGPTAAEIEPVVDTLDTRFGPLLLRVAVRPELANDLVIGGLPRSRLPLLLGIFVLTLGLAAVAIVQLRHQHELVRLRSRFIASVSHELRTPLAQIRLFSELLRSDRLRDEQRQRSIRVIDEEAQRLTYLVENVLRFSRSEQQPERVSPRPTDLGSLIHEIVTGFAPLASASGTTLETKVQSRVVGQVDSDALRQVLLNLLDNAVKYGRRDQTVTVGLEQEGERIRIWVDDEGPGIPPADRGRIWEPYRRLQHDVESSTGGSGIGLAVVRELVELHGGEVSVEPSPAGGARFVVRLPAEPATSRVAAEASLVKQGVGGEA